MASYRVSTKSGLKEARISKLELFRILIPPGIDPNIVETIAWDAANDELVFTFPLPVATMDVPLTDTDPPPLGP